MINQIAIDSQDGQTDVIAPSAVVPGQALLVGFLFCLAIAGGSSGDRITVKTRGVYDIPAVTTDVIAAWAKVYWDNTAKLITTTASANTLVGLAYLAKTNGQTTCKVWLPGQIV